MSPMLSFYAMACVMTVRTSNEFEDQKWNTDNDICTIKSFNRTTNRVKKVAIRLLDSHTCAIEEDGSFDTRDVTNND